MFQENPEEAPVRGLVHPGHVRRHAVSLLGSARRDPKTGDDFIEDEQASELRCEVTKAFEKTALRRDDPHVSRDRLDENRRDLISLASEEVLDGIEIVVSGQ